MYCHDYAIGLLCKCINSPTVQANAGRGSPFCLKENKLRVFVLPVRMYIKNLCNIYDWQRGFCRKKVHLASLKKLLCIWWFDLLCPSPLLTILDIQHNFGFDEPLKQSGLTKKKIAKQKNTGAWKIPLRKSINDSEALNIFCSRCMPIVMSKRKAQART